MSDCTVHGVALAVTPWTRLKGLLDRHSFTGILVLAPCKDIHTFGMRMRIDVAFLDGRGIVVRSDCDVGPGRRLSCKSAVVVIERQASKRDPWPQVGDRMGIGFLSAGKKSTKD